jgi:hypothetical protein
MEARNLSNDNANYSTNPLLMDDEERRTSSITAGEPLFQGELPKKRVGISYYFKSEWKHRFLRLYFDRIEYGNWNRFGRLLLRNGSPMMLDHTMEVSVIGDHGPDRQQPRLIIIRCRKKRGKGLVEAAFQDNPQDKKKKGTKLLKQLQIVEKVHKALYLEKQIIRSEHLDCTPFEVTYASWLLS